MDVYGHLLPSVDERLSEGLDETFGGASVKSPRGSRGVSVVGLEDGKRRKRS